MRPLSRLFNGQRPTRQPSVGPDGLRCREQRSTGELIPDRQRESEVHVLRAVQLVVNPLTKIRSRGPKPKFVFECAKATVAP
jgi:hypothetical protein